MPASSKEFLDIQAIMSVDSLWNAYMTWQEHAVILAIYYLPFGLDHTDWISTYKVYYLSMKFLSYLR